MNFFLSNTCLYIPIEACVLFYEFNLCVLQGWNFWHIFSFGGSSKKKNWPQYYNHRSFTGHWIEMHYLVFHSCNPVYLFLPETKGIPIEEMSFMWRKHWF